MNTFITDNSDALFQRADEIIQLLNKSSSLRYVSSSNQNEAYQLRKQALHLSSSIIERPYIFINTYKTLCQVINTSNIRFLRLPTVIERTGLSRSTIYLRIAEGKFPKQISLGGRAAGWVESEIDTWMREQIQLSRNK